jgi:hypothetical protein
MSQSRPSVDRIFLYTVKIRSGLDRMAVAKGAIAANPPGQRPPFITVLKDCVANACKGLSFYNSLL